jgi:hypothetical protein
MKYTWTLMLLLFGAALFTSCNDDDDQPDDPVIPNEEEVITTFNYTLVSAALDDTVRFTFRDLDGDGGAEPEIFSEPLQANTTYTGRIQLLNELEDPIEDKTEEIEEEDDEHQFFFSTDVAGFSFTYNDFDGNNNPLGLETTVVTGDAGNGSMTVTLRHEPDKDAPGVSSGDITNAGGETDIEVTWTVDVQ